MSDFYSLTSTAPLWVSARPVGSRVTCSVIPAGADEDWLVLVTPTLQTSWTRWLHGEGWIDESERYDASQFTSWRHGDVNLLLTADKEWHEKFLLATAVCTKLDLRERDDRLVVFRALLYGETPS